MQHRLSESILLYTFLTFASSFANGSEKTIEQTRDIAARLAVVEKRVNSLYVKGEMTTAITEPTANDSDVPGPSAKWTSTPESVAASVWMNTAMDGPFRVDFEKEVFQWIGVPEGKPNYGQRSRRVVFDGKKLTNFVSEEGFLNETQKTPRAEVLPDDSSERGFNNLQTVSGMMFTPLQWELSSRMSLSAYINAYLGWHQANKEKYTPILRVSAGNDPSKMILTMGYVDMMEETWTFDTSKEWLLTEFERRAGAKRILTDYFTVTKSERVGEKIWYPSEAYHVFSSRQLERESVPTMQKYRASSIRVNDQSIDDAITNVKLPAGTVVNDQTTKRVYTTSPRTTN